MLVGDDDPIDEQLEQLPPLLKGRRGQALADAAAECLDVGTGLRHVDPAGGLRFQLARLPRQRLDAGLQIMPPAAVLLQPEDLLQVSLGESLELLSQARRGAPEVVPTRLQLLGQPGAGLGTLQRLGDGRRVLQERAEVGPDELIQLPRRDES